MTVDFNDVLPSVQTRPHPKYTMKAPMTTGLHWTDLIFNAMMPTFYRRELEVILDESTTLIDAMLVQDTLVLASTGLN